MSMYTGACNRPLFGGPLIVFTGNTPFIVNCDYPLFGGVFLVEQSPYDLLITDGLKLNDIDTYNIYYYCNLLDRFVLEELKSIDGIFYRGVIDSLKLNDVNSNNEIGYSILSEEIIFGEAGTPSKNFNVYLMMDLN